MKQKDYIKNLGCARSSIDGLSIEGKLVIVGISTDRLEVYPLTLIRGKRSIAGWSSGSSIDSQDTLAFSAQMGVKPMNEIFPLEEAEQAYRQMMSGRARFRVVLTTGNS